jgi:hypothetical protein
VILIHLYGGGFFNRILLYRKQVYRLFFYGFFFNRLNAL